MLVLGRLETGARVHWKFKIAGAETDVEVVAADPNRRLDLRWDDTRTLTITFDDRGDTTLVGVRIADFTGDDAAAEAIGTMSGFTLVLASLKMLLEHNIEGDLMYD
ncbi:hypothetical protein M1L60_02620 [Actinoplanes sp. TRM 88003]|uniref:Activator of Hsp90 ATPase homologue 1/2-like C-terminal domain-containing protein n=1 Tax=Paractinoplanes aksuensis TaxID=2939490 RepID=A0ABT1DHB9_9ACTN|nr:SRPBCC domain-containing protein [Actinoplanes aksuensis]MCO8269481.1 hypothetical protein [Actinoplanes aksuensis]